MVKKCIYKVCAVAFFNFKTYVCFSSLDLYNNLEFEGGAIWHPRCGPGPTENGAVLNGVENGHCTDTETEAESGRDTAFDRMSSSAVSDMQVFRQMKLGRIILLSVVFFWFCFYY